MNNQKASKIAIFILIIILAHTILIAIYDYDIKSTEEYSQFKLYYLRILYKRYFGML